MAYTKEMKDPAGMKDVLLAICPKDANGNRGFRQLAQLLGVHHYTVYKWVNHGVLPAKQAQKLVALSKGKLTHKALHKFVFPEND